MPLVPNSTPKPLRRAGFGMVEALVMAPTTCHSHRGIWTSAHLSHRSLWWWCCSHGQAIFSCIGLWCTRRPEAAWSDLDFRYRGLLFSLWILNLKTSCVCCLFLCADRALSHQNLINCCKSSVEAVHKRSEQLQSKRGWRRIEEACSYLDCFQYHAFFCWPLDQDSWSAWCSFLCWPRVLASKQSLSQSWHFWIRVNNTSTPAALAKCWN